MRRGPARARCPMVRVSALTLVALLGGASAAAAADLPPLPPLEPSAPISVGEGWYLRGDVGVGSTRTNSARPVAVANAPVANGFTPLEGGFIRNQIPGGPFYGGGVGYRFGPFIRGDITVQGIAPSTFKGYTNTGHYQASTATTLGLVNAYVDLGTWYGITPFVGAGVGVAYNRLGGVSRIGLAYPLGTMTSYDLMSGATKTETAAAIYAGLAYDVMPGVTLEMGYRYLAIGGFGSGAAFCSTTYGCTAATPLKVKGVASQQLTFGLRWELGSI